MSHFVYLYRDESGKVRYVGYGAKGTRSLSHLTGSHNEALDELLRKEPLKLEVAGPFNDKTTALAVETALISALRLGGELTNVAQGHEPHRFRPLGVPLEFASRWTMPPLTRMNLDEVLAAHKSPQFICVLIQAIDFGDGRGGFDPASPPDQNKLLERILGHWNLASKKKQWSQHPEQSPAILLAVHGKPNARFVIASVAIDVLGWPGAEEEHIPIVLPPQLDVAQLRGRRIAPEANLKFNQGGFRLFP